MPNFNWEVKRCSRCHRWLALEWCFARDRSRGDGLHHRCRECSADLKAVHYEANKKEYRVRLRQRYEANKAKIAARYRARPMVTAERLRELLTYDPKTGIFRDRDGALIGAVYRDGYWRIYIDGRPYRAHRLAWLYQKGEWPPNEIDHRDLDRANNRWTNLRAAANGQNHANTRARVDNQLGVKGVRLGPDGKFLARIRIDHKERHLGSFPTIEAASAAYAAAAKAAWGEYARAGADARREQA